MSPGKTYSRKISKPFNRFIEIQQGLRVLSKMSNLVAIEMVHCSKINIEWNDYETDLSEIISVVQLPSLGLNSVVKELSNYFMVCYCIFLIISGRVITAAYVPLPNYSQLFPDSVRASQPLMSSSQALQAGYTNGFLTMPTSIR